MPFRSPSGLYPEGGTASLSSVVAPLRATADDSGASSVGMINPKPTEARWGRSLQKLELCVHITYTLHASPPSPFRKQARTNSRLNSVAIKAVMILCLTWVSDQHMGVNMKYRSIKIPASHVNAHHGGTTEYPSRENDSGQLISASP